MMIAMHEQLPDLRVTIEDMVAEGDKVVCRNVWRERDATVTGSSSRASSSGAWQGAGSSSAGPRSRPRTRRDEVARRVLPR